MMTTTQLSFSEWTVKKIMRHPYHKLLLSKKKELTIDTIDTIDLDESQESYDTIDTIDLDESQESYA